MASKRWMISLVAAFAAFSASASASPEPTARPALSGEAADSLNVLSDDDVARYVRAFELQDEGDFAAADREVAAVKDDSLKGYFLAERYLGAGYRATYEELKRWMAFYADHPEADDIYALAMKRKPKKEVGPQRPLGRKWRVAEGWDLPPALVADYQRTNKAEVQRIEGRVRMLVKDENVAAALKELSGHLERGAITERQYDRMRSWAAAGLYYQGHLDGAEALSEEVAKRNGDAAVLARWIAGLVAFREGDMKRAAEHFSRQAAVVHQDDPLRSAGGFWAARAALAGGRPDLVAPNLEIAAKFPYTFYGQLALAQLGRTPDYDWTPPPVTRQGFAALVAAAPSARRAAALAQIGLKEEADIELRWANGLAAPPLDKELLAVAAALDLPAAQIDIALTGRADYLEAGLYPIPHFEPKSGFAVDRALIYALMRQESKFKTEATSRVGARGLMQLMPKTASYMAKDKSLARAAGRDRLYDPAYNLDLGQSYVNHLIRTSARGDLFQMALAYNGGPGNLSKWKRDLGIEDPLLFIESIPNPESRDFVEKVLTNIWVYHARLGQTPLTRDKVAAGQLPLYEALDKIAKN
ncbi:MAG: lytic transglycosylase domain-containing protein [Parvularculaceae bacterium]|nr:lytic transglycosylase domain-containing protein [Parvularculaceae bacterium]